MSGGDSPITAQGALCEVEVAQGHRMSSAEKTTDTEDRQLFEEAILGQQQRNIIQRIVKTGQVAMHVFGPISHSSRRPGQHSLPGLAEKRHSSLSVRAPSSQCPTLGWSQLGFQIICNYGVLKVKKSFLKRV